MKDNKNELNKLIIFVIGIVLLLTFVILNIITSYSKNSTLTYKDNQVIRQDDIVNDTLNMIKSSTEKEELIKSKLKKTPQEQKIEYLGNNKEIHYALFALISDFNEQLMANNFENAYNMLEVNVLESYYESYEVEDLEGFIESIYEEFYPYKGSILFNLDSYIDYQTYYLCKVDVFADHVGEEGLQSDVRFKIEFSLFKKDDSYKIVPYSIESLDMVYRN